MIAHYRKDEWGRYANQTGVGTKEHLTEPQSVAPVGVPGGVAAEITWRDRWGRDHYILIHPETLAKLAPLAPQEEQV